MFLALKILMTGLGGAAVLIATSIMLFGAGATAQVGFVLFDSVASSRVLWSPDADSELRFYAAFWMAFGVLAIRAARDPYAPGSATPWLALVFFLGGCGRLLSLILVGAPHPFFTALMALELALPPLLYVLWQAGLRQSPSPADRP